MITLRFDVPVDPDAPEARRWLEEELLKPEYQAAKPTWWDEMVSNVFEWLGRLLTGGVQGGPPGTSFLVLGVVIVVLLLIAFLIFGLPRINRRSKAVGVLFGEHDARSAASMRAAAEKAASRGDYAAAIAEMFRSIARGLAERTVLSTNPGTTARDFAVRAAIAFPASAAALDSAADAFDGVRYLGRTGTAEQFREVAQLERALRSAKPATLEAVNA